MTFGLKYQTLLDNTAQYTFGEGVKVRDESKIT